MHLMYKQSLRQRIYLLDLSPKYGTGGQYRTQKNAFVDLSELVETVIELVLVRRRLNQYIKISGFGRHARRDTLLRLLL